MAGGQLKEVRNRIKSIQSTQQITKAMKMISATKLRKAQESILQMRPFAKKMKQVLNNIVSNAEGNINSELSVVRPVGKVLLIVITSDRASCGAYNSNLIKLTKSRIQEKYSAQAAKGEVQIWSIGKKGYEHFAKNKFKVSSTYRDMLLHLTLDQVRDCAQTALNGFKNKEFDVVELVYSEFKNAATQRFIVEQFLPVSKIEARAAAKSVDFIFEPDQNRLIEELMPKLLNVQLYKAILDANASEHGARMTAMDKATENANEILRTLRISYNRARQAAITTELTEIVSGAAALQG
ncbi:MAG TPA: ATP synthase F1 subunit gamma [Puia sp.]|nr:ATP synthase F1 subunit gamma [Puia sp.]